jgi:hypothetical protein
MPRFLVEVPHDEETVACARVVKVFLTSGSHYLTQAEWGCMDGDHRSWMIVDADDKKEALAIVPQFLRSEARVISLNRFSVGQIDEILKNHPSASS